MARKHGARGISETERRMILISAAGGVPALEIAETLGRSVTTIYKILAKHRAGSTQDCLPLVGGFPDER